MKNFLVISAGLFILFQATIGSPTPGPHPGGIIDGKGKAQRDPVDCECHQEACACTGPPCCPAKRS
ncbi:hypothetical protein PTTG_25921 [Puccinia triticina 1-1 BBBD Race 1]|uniref:Uncharacterized protein n=1 Tax=Puccinia triticina (isolate 1-1 / race 1 (BBBD)) TaxID=630390 RepID=A0A180GXY4_PUCT1|nr:hypothetical protein PTTG_25921 [Puccinia triticina 1-1 BBBD Race 1]